MEKFKEFEWLVEGYVMECFLCDLFCCFVLGSDGDERGRGKRRGRGRVMNKDCLNKWMEVGIIEFRKS